MSEPINIFIIYAKEDKEIKLRLLAHLNPLKNLFNLSIWHDDFIEAGQEWKPHITSRLEQADVFILLVSIDFMNSEFINQVEFKYAIERHKTDKSIVIPVIINYCQWDVDIDFKDYIFNLNELQVLPEEAKPIGDWKTPDQALNNIAAGIKKVLHTIKTRRELRASEEEEKKKREREKAAQKLEEEKKQYAIKQEERKKPEVEITRQKIEEEQKQNKIKKKEGKKAEVEKESEEYEKEMSRKKAERTQVLEESQPKEQEEGADHQYGTEPGNSKRVKRIIYVSIALLAVVLFGYFVFYHPKGINNISSNETKLKSIYPDTGNPMREVVKDSPKNFKPEFKPDLPLVSKIYSRGILKLQYQYTYDLDMGKKIEDHDGNLSNYDFSWLHPTSMTYALYPVRAVFSIIGKKNFSAIDKTYLGKLKYSKNTIESSKLTKGTIVGVRTKEGRYGKFYFLDDEYGEPSISLVTYE